MRTFGSIYISLLLSGMSGVVLAQQTEPTALSVPIYNPISWQASSNNALARPAPPGGLTIVGRPSSSELNEFIGAWKREKDAAGELRSFILEPEGVLTVVFLGVKTNLTAKGKWEFRDTTIHFQLTSQTEKTSIPALRETKFFIVREAVGIILVGERNARFVRPKP